MILVLHYLAVNTRCEDDALPNIKWVLDLAKAAVLRHGVRGLVIDPYNELDHQRPPNM
jgi:twinkle protein